MDLSALPPEFLHIRTVQHDGGSIHFFHTPPEEIRIGNIAFGLAGQFRYTGQSRISVAQHLVVGSYLVPPEYALDFLGHDIPEWLWGDVSRPIKRMFPGIVTCEDHTHAICAEKYGFRKEIPDVVRYVDDKWLLTEKTQIFGIGEDAFLRADAVAFSMFLEPWSSEEAEIMFLARFHDLTGYRFYHEVDATIDTEALAELLSNLHGRAA